MRSRSVWRVSSRGYLIAGILAGAVLLSSGCSRHTDEVSRLTAREAFLAKLENGALKAKLAKSAAKRERATAALGLRPFDAPDKARAHFLLKRTPPGPDNLNARPVLRADGFDPQLYVEAMEAARVMPVYSS